MFMDTKNMIGQRIKQRREEIGMTQAELGASLWLNKSTIQRYETGKITKIKVPVIHAIANQLNVDPNWLMGESEKMGEFIPRFDKFEKWEDEIHRKRIANNDTSFELDYSEFSMLDDFCEIRYDNIEEIEIMKKIIRGLDDLTIEGKSKAYERICELQDHPKYSRYIFDHE